MENNLIKKKNVSISSRVSPEKDKIMMIHWNGRFGNRMGSYAFGNVHMQKNII